MKVANTPPKKKWTTPEMYLLDAPEKDEFTYVRESTGHLANFGGQDFWIKGSKTVGNARAGQANFSYLGAS